MSSNVDPVQIFETIIGKDPEAFLRESVYQVTESEVREFARQIVVPIVEHPNWPQWISCKEEMPDEGVNVLVKYISLDQSVMVHGAKRFKAFDHLTHLFWFNDRGEAMRGEVLDWIPMTALDTLSKTGLPNPPGPTNSPLIKDLTDTVAQQAEEIKRLKLVEEVWKLQKDLPAAMIEAMEEIDRLKAVVENPPVAEVADMKYNRVRFYRATGDRTKPYLLPGTKLYTSPPELAELQATIAQQTAEIERLKAVTNFKEAVACVFDNLKMVAANTSSKVWDDQLEELAEEVIEFSPEYQKQWKDICDLERENRALTAALNQALFKF
jgi:hypothetical protein